ncbi:hypothetical protein EOM86_10140 [Candidatus Nomurabacteria bacterium]|nr:hypothetical protein [Candidatus Nomurabacteria bacterium]
MTKSARKGGLVFIERGIIMDSLVCKLILSGGEKVVITFSDGRKLKAVYKETYGYTHCFSVEGGGELKLSNHFMDMKDINVKLNSDN